MGEKTFGNEILRYDNIISYDLYKNNKYSNIILNSKFYCILQNIYFE